MRKVLAYTWIAVVIAALYVAWVFYSRHERTVREEQEVQKRKHDEAERVNKAIFGSGEIQFTTFAAEPGVLRPGEKGELCYGVVNAVRAPVNSFDAGRFQ